MPTDLLDSLLSRKVPLSILGSRTPRTIGTYPETLEVDSDGYPSESMLDKIPLIGLLDAIRWVFTELPRLWRTIPYSSCTVEESEKVLRVTYSTGGWSGAEAVMTEVLNHRLMASFCVAEHRGGHFTFEISKTLLNEHSRSDS
jgi:hypothetical protein